MNTKHGKHTKRREASTIFAEWAMQGHGMSASGGPKPSKMQSRWAMAVVCAPRGQAFVDCPSPPGRRRDGLLDRGSKCPGWLPPYVTPGTAVHPWGRRAWPQRCTAQHCAPRCAGESPKLSPAAPPCTWHPRAEADRRTYATGVRVCHPQAGTLARTVDCIKAPRSMGVRPLPFAFPPWPSAENPLQRLNQGRGKLMWEALWRNC